MRVETQVRARRLGALLLLLLTACGSAGPGDPTRDDGTERVEPTPLGEFQDGLITFYDADGSGSCGFEPSPQDLDVAAINGAQYANSAACGGCVEIEGPKGTVRVRIVDECPDCTASGHLDLSPDAFAKVADRAAGRVDVRWRPVTCDVEGPVRYHFKEGSSATWTAIQVRNHRVPVAKLEYLKNGAWVDVRRESNNYFVEPAGMGTGPIRVRVTASDGQALEDTLQSAASDETYDGAAQFKAR